MDDLRVIGVENGALLVSANDGERYRLPVDEVVQSKLRQSVPESLTGDKLSPRDIQSQIRSGMSAEDVASLTGMHIDHIRKYEGPVLAEREYVVQTAQSVPVHTALESDPPVDGMTFGTAIMSRLHVIGGANERWASWKDPVEGWIVKLAFTTDDIEHDARWRFDPKKLALAPLNNEATTLSQQGEIRTALIPRLRAVSTAEREADSSRFDSGAFALDDSAHGNTGQIGGSSASGSPLHHEGSGAHSAPTESQETTAPSETNHTADLLDALRRRRGEREGASYGDEDTAELPTVDPATDSIRLVSVPLDDFPVVVPTPHRSTGPQAFVPISKSSRKNRVAMPSWDDIVFGARSEDDPA
jgi:Protein of unknown function (DUF3071)